MNTSDKCRSWFCVWKNPREFFTGCEPPDMAERALDMWINDHPTRTGAVAYCISAQGLIHFHMVLEDSNMARFSALKKIYPKAHLEPTKGTKEQAEDYINKRGKFAEKGEQVVYVAKYGEIKGSQGQRKDLEIIQSYIDQGMTPRAIIGLQIGFRRYEKLIRDSYFFKRSNETTLISTPASAIYFWMSFGDRFASAPSWPCCRAISNSFMPGIQISLVCGTRCI